MDYPHELMARWQLQPDGDPFTTHTSRLFPVKMAQGKAMLKLTDDADERLGGQLMAWWAGNGAAKVLAHEEGAVLLERAISTTGLLSKSCLGDDSGACTILCATANRLHAQCKPALPGLTPLETWFKELEPAARKQGGIMLACLDAANMLLSNPQDIVVLHGDLHHGNVLDFGSSGWLAIDPKGLIGERGFDFANIFTNPDLIGIPSPVATVPEIFQRRVDIVAKEARLDRQRLLNWILAWCGLSTAWSLGSDDFNPVTLQIAELAIKAR